MLKLLVLLVIPGMLTEFMGEDFRKTRKVCSPKNIVHGLLFGYILFLLDATLIYLLFPGQYVDFLSFLSRRIETIEDLFLMVLLWFVQVSMALGIGLSVRMVRCRSIEYAFSRLTAMQAKAMEGVIGISLTLVVLLFAAKDNAENQLVINEVCSRNDRVMMDDSGEYGDYIEIYNASKWNILLKNFHLSDNKESVDKLKLGEVVVPAKGYSIIWVDSAHDGNGFSINSEGESIYLAKPDGEILDMVVVPKLQANAVYTRVTDGDEEWTEGVPSPLAENDERKKYIEQPLFSAESGFYDGEFRLSITANEGEKIYYTLDGSIPDENSILYTEDILVKNVSDNPNVYRSVQNTILDWKNNNLPTEPVDKAFIVRAVSVDGYGNTSDVVTKTYFVNMNQYKDKYVLSMVSDPRYLFGDDGIYVTGKSYDDWYLGSQEGGAPTVNYMKKGRESEIEASVALFHNTLLMEQTAGLRIQGASERERIFKRFSLFARKEYNGSRYFDYELFGKEMHSFFLRQDFEDAFIHSLVTDRSVGTLDAVPVAVFLDGEYWYDTYMREKYNEDYLALVYQVESDEVCLVERIPDEIYQFLDGHDLSQEEDYRQFCELVDLQSYIDYLAINIYMCNMDASETKNCRTWKATATDGESYSDGRWRWLVYDMDSLSWNSIAYYQAMRYDIDSFSQPKQYAGVAYNQEKLYQALRVNEEFCKRFVLTFMDLANTNFSHDTVAEKIVAWGRDMSWNDGFFENRFQGIVPALAKEFELQGTLEDITLCVNEEQAGYVTINTTTPNLRDGSWTGKYYTDYPVTITAITEDGYEFVGWKNGDDIVNEAQITVQLDNGGCTWEALFERK